MKKIILSAFVACAAVFTQAELAKWGLQGANLMDGTGGTDAANKIARNTPTFIFDGGFISQEEVFNAWAKGSDLAKLSGFVVETATSTEGGYIARNCPFEYGTAGTEEKIKFFFVVPDGNSKIYISKTLELQPFAPGMQGSLTYGSHIDSTKGQYAQELPTNGYSTTGRWAAVPEPTSALLMLLGMAGLAIRRRRA